MTMLTRLANWRILQILVIFAGLWQNAMVAYGQQTADSDYKFEITKPAHKQNSGPRILFDATHSPFVRRGSFEPLMSLARDDGFRTETHNARMSAEILQNADLLVIINAYRRDYRDFSVMEPPSPYGESEMMAIHDWVKKGGRLLMIADHAPFSGGISKLAEKFGFSFFNSVVVEVDSLPFFHGDILYSPSNGLNLASPIFTSGVPKITIDHFFTFTGSVFISPADAAPLLTLPPGYRALIAKTTQTELSNAPKIDVSGLSQGATLEYGAGRVAVFAEAASFSAQIINKLKLHGMNNPRADQNALFVLATLRWLTR